MFNVEKTLVVLETFTLALVLYWLEYRYHQSLVIHVKNLLFALSIYDFHVEYL